VAFYREVGRMDKFDEEYSEAIEAGIDCLESLANGGAAYWDEAEAAFRAATWAYTFDLGVE
jgi:hypothetical protein